MICLGRKQRNFMRYVWNHWEKYPHQPCFVPKGMDAGPIKTYMNMLESLEQKKLIKINRTSKNYRQWTITKPEKFQ